MLKLSVIIFCLSCDFLTAHEDSHDVIHELTHKLEDAKKADKADLYFKRAAEYRTSGQKAKAVEDLLAYIKLEQFDFLGWLELSRLEEDYDKRLLHLVRSLALAKTDGEKAQIYLGFSMHFYSQGNDKDALMYCERSIQMNSQKELTPLLLKSHLLWKLGQLEERVSFLTEAKTVHHSIVLENNWIEAMTDAGRGVELKKLIDKGIRESRFESSWLIRAALCAPKQSEAAKALANKAITEIKTRLNVKRPDTTLLMDLARAYSITGEYEKSQHYLKLVKAKPHDAWMVSELEQKIRASKRTLSVQ